MVAQEQASSQQLSAPEPKVLAFSSESVWSWAQSPQEAPRSALAQEPVLKQQWALAETLLIPLFFDSTVRVPLLPFRE